MMLMKLFRLSNDLNVRASKNSTKNEIGRRPRLYLKTFKSVKIYIAKSFRLSWVIIVFQSVKNVKINYGNEAK